MLTYQKEQILAFNNEILNISSLDSLNQKNKKEESFISYKDNDLFSFKDDVSKNFFGTSIVNAEENKSENISLSKEIKVQNKFQLETLDFSQRQKKEKDINQCGLFHCYSSNDFIKIYKDFESSRGLSIEDKSIYNNNEIDSYIKKLAENRGYQKRIFANKDDIIQYKNIRTRKEVYNAYLTMSQEMKNDGMSLHLVSGYRSAIKQQNIFKNKLGDINFDELLNGYLDEKVLNVLKKISIPGYSKHHSGYAVDFGCGNDYLVYSFAETDCYQWLSKNNFENAKRFGFIPSYPNDIKNQGPDPEPWEFVWVGKDFLSKY